jgi:capsule polysaccharide export protein KpsC/LpsZ
MDRALKSIKKIKKLRISKYNLTEKAANEAVYNQFGEIKLGQKRILVIGQVEDDASIIYGSPHCSSNGYLVWKARQRNPDAQIFFRPHPDTVAGKRKVKTSLSEIENISHVIYSSMSLASAFNSIDEVYTITSLSGFEALMHGKHVVTLGNPFYAGWGLTEDLHPLDRRKRKLSVEEVFAAAYILYPNYNNPFTGETMDLNDAISMISLGIEHRKVRESIMGELN